jgi:hemoglobin
MKLVPVLLSAALLCCCASQSASEPATVRPARTIARAEGSAPSAPAATATPAPASGTSYSLYKRLGGYDAISAVTDEFLRRMITDKQLGRYFVGLSTPSKDTLRQHVVEFLCHETGGPCSYVGRGVDEVHQGLHITESDWKIAVADLSGTLDQFHVPDREKGELISAVAKFKDDIVGK